MTVISFIVGIGRAASRRSAGILIVLATALSGTQPAFAQTIELTATPNVIRPTNGKLPAAVTITLQPRSSGDCDDKHSDWSKDSLTVAGNAGVSISPTPTLSSKCLAGFTATIDPNVPPGTYKLLLTTVGDDGKSKVIRGSTDISVADANAGPIPPGLQPGVDVLWEVMSQKKCMDVFGARVGQSNYCIRLNSGTIRDTLFRSPELASRPT